MNKKFIGLVEYTLKKENIDTKGMSQDEKIDKFNELPQEVKNKLTKKEKKTTMKKDTDLTPKANHIMLPPAEYAPFCSRIVEQYTNNIPARGDIYLSNYYYVFKYNKRTCKAVCLEKLHIDIDADRINKWESELHGEDRI